VFFSIITCAQTFKSSFSDAKQFLRKKSILVASPENFAEKV
jgi:hypothetical protein